MSRASEQISLEAESELLIAFVNTRDFEGEKDEIGSPQALERWLSTSDRGVGAPAVDPAGHRRVLALRESIRALLHANNGGKAADSELAPLREAAEGARFHTSLSAGGDVRIGPDGGSLDAFEAGLLLAIERIQSLGGWERLKACPADDCQWAFLDTSRNRSRTWCSMEVCGNRSKTRRYRSRRAG